MQRSTFWASLAKSEMYKKMHPVQILTFIPKAAGA